MTGTRTDWTCQLIGWGLYAAVVPAITAFQRPLTWADGIGALWLGAWGLALTHGYREIIRRRRWTEIRT